MKICLSIAIVALAIGFILLAAAGKSIDASATPGDFAVQVIEGKKAFIGGIFILIAFFSGFAGFGFWKAR